MSVFNVYDDDDDDEYDDYPNTFFSFYKCLKNRDFSAIEYLPCFNGYAFSSMRGITARKLLESVYFDFLEDDLETQKRFYLLLDKIIDGICQLSFKNNRKVLYSNVNQIDNFILDSFAKIDLEYNSVSLKEVTSFIIDNIVRDKTYWDECYANINNLFQIYINDGKVAHNYSINFYNEILNRQQNNYFREKKLYLIKELCKMLPYTKRKEKSLINGAKLEKIDLYLKEQRYESLGTTEIGIREKLQDFDKYLSSLKTLRKEKYVVTEEQCRLMNEKFLKGNLSFSDVQDICLGISVKSANIVYDKYVQVKMNYLSSVEVDEEELPDIELGYNYNNYKIVWKERYHNNLTEIFSKLKEEDALILLKEAENNKTIFLLIFFIDYFSELSSERVLGILKNYSRIIRDLGGKSNVLNSFGLSFDKLLLFGEAYNSANDFTISILGNEVVTKITNYLSSTSKNPQDYLNVYMEMLCRDRTYMPPVTGEYGNYYYESAHDADRERLLIGKNCYASCIGIDGAGEDAYIESLLDKTGDVILFKDKDTKEFVARCLCFRRSNYVVLAPFYGKNGIAEELYNCKLISDISSQMINKAKKSNDNLEYIFLTDPLGLLDNKYKLFGDDCLFKPFPHADLYFMKYLIGSRYNDIENVKLNSLDGILSTYETLRDKVKVTDEISDIEINKLRALDILFLSNKYLKEDKIKEFKIITKNDFDEVFLGQDWYIAIKDGKVVDNIVLPVGSERQNDEILKICKYLVGAGFVENIDDILFNDNVVSGVRASIRQ